MQETGVWQVLSCQPEKGRGKASECPRLLPLRNEGEAPGFLQQPHLTDPREPGALFSYAETPQTWIKTLKHMFSPSKRTKARESALSFWEDSHQPRVCRMFHL